MNLVLIIFVVVVLVVLFASAVIVMMKIFGTGMFYGLQSVCTFVLDENDSVQETLMQITESLGSECEYSGTKILIIDGGMNRGQREICRLHCERYNYFLFCTPDKTNEILFSLKKGKEV